MKKILLITFIFCSQSTSILFSHGVGLNPEVCHNNRKTVGYHCHLGNNNSNSSVKNREEKKGKYNRDNWNYSSFLSV